MINIGSFFEKFLKLDRSNDLVIATIQSCLDQIAKVKIKKEEIELKNGKAYIRSSPVIRNQIFMSKTKIENFLETQNIFIKIF